MNILVTGGAGFIGSKLCERLISEGHKVICVDNLYTGNLSNISKLMSYPNFKFLNEDIVSFKFPSDYELDCIYHLACPASPKHYQKDPIYTLKTNVVGTLNVLEIARQRQAKVLLASTSEVYGEPLEHPQTEEYRGNVNCIGIRACYDEGKRAAETLLFDFHRQYNLDCVLVRIFNTYGENMSVDDGRAVSEFITKALQDMPVEVYGDGSQTRCFCYIEDMVDALQKAMECSDNIGPFNIGNDQEVTVDYLANKIIEMCDSKSSIIYKTLPKDDPSKRKPDISKAATILKWKPKVSLEKGLDFTITYFKKCLY